MAEVVSIKVTTSGVNAAIKELTRVQTIVDTLNKTPVKITVDTSGVQASMKNLADVINKTTGKAGIDSSSIKAATVEADKFVKVFTDGNLTRTIKDVTTGIGATKQIIHDIGEEETKVTEKFTTNYKAQRKFMEEADAAYAAYKKELEDNAPLTAMQRQVDAITGVSKEFQSAEQYAKRFIEHGVGSEEARVNAQLLNDALAGIGDSYGKVIDSQTVFENGLPIKQVQTYRDELGNVTKVTAQFSDNMVRVTQNSRENSEQMKKQADAAELAAKKNSLLGDSLDRIVAKIVAWQVINATVATVIRSFRDAVQTMREVDQELTNIQKVSDLTAEEIARIGDSAYATASKYGVAANEYLQAVYTFQKAGLGDSAEQMAELATKTMLVGDTSADVATQFLISANAAWKFGGSVEELSRIVDEADKLNNNYAVSLQDIAEGLPIVGATAAQVGMTAEQTMAAISTIVASTGQSASKAATALRAIIMNLIGETGELDDGTKVTEESIKSLNTVLIKYARSSLEAAEAEGKILDPMEAIAALAKSAEDGFLNQAELFDVLSGLGGKLRTTQLTALVNNMEMYNAMLKDTADAAGTADKEIATMLESWNAKTQILKNTWTEFLTHFINSNTMKTVIDALTATVEILDTGFGRASVTVLGLSAGISALIKHIPNLTQKLLGGGLIAGIKALVTAIQAGEGAVGAFTAVWNVSPFAVATVAIGVIYGIVKAVDALKVTFDEQKEKLSDLKAQYDELHGIGSELEQLKSITEGLTEEEQKRLGVLQAQSNELDKQLKKQKEQTFLAWRKQQDEGIEWYQDENVPESGRFVNFNITERQVSEAKNALNDIADAMMDGEMTSRQYEAAISALVNTLQESAEAIQLGVDAGKTLSAEEQELLDLYNRLSSTLGGMAAKKAEDTSATKENTNATNEAAAANETLQKAFDEVEKKSSLTYGTLAELEALYPGLSARILDANGNLTAEGQAALSTKSAFQNLIAQIIIFNNTGLDVGGKIAALQSLYNAAVSTGNAVNYAIANETQAWMSAGYNYKDAENMALNNYANTLANQKQPEDFITGGGGGGGGGGKSEDAALTTLKQIVTDEKARYELMVKQGATAEELAAQATKIQAALHDQAERMRELGASYSDVAALSKEWFDWEEKKNKAQQDGYAETVSALKNQLDFLEASGASEEEQVAKMREIQDALHKQAEYMRSIKADEEEIRKLSTEWWNIEKKILDITEKIAQKLRDEISTTLGDIADSLEAAQKAAVKPLQEQLDALEAARNATQERRDEEEKIAAVQEKQLELEKARIALENAQKERTVRQYNAKTGQWEWVANAKNVETAQQNLEKAQQNLIDAQEALAKYYEDVAYNEQKANLEKQIKATNSAFDAFRNAINEAAQAIRDGKMSFAEAYLYIKNAMHQIYDEYGIDLSNVMDDVTAKLEKEFNKPIKKLSDMEEAIQKAIEEIKAKSSDPAKAIDEFARAIYLALESNDPEAAIAALVQRVMDGAESFNDIDSLLADVNDETNRLLLIAKMQANSAEWHTAGSDRQAELHAENERIGAALGWTYDNSGFWYNERGEVAYTPGGSGSSAFGTYSDDFFTKLSQTLYDAISNITINVNASGGGGSASSSASSSGVSGDVLINQRAQSSQQIYQNYTDRIAAANSSGTGSTTTTSTNTNRKKYDSGGILHGLGGIKATREDEMILPPDATRALLNAEADGTFDSLVKHLGIVVGTAYRIAGYGGARPSSAIGSQHNGDVYEIDGVTLTETQARGMTVYDLAQMGRSLALRKGG